MVEAWRGKTRAGIQAEVSDVNGDCHSVLLPMLAMKSQVGRNECDTKMQVCNDRSIVLEVAVRIVEGYRSALMVDTAFGWAWQPTLLNLGFRLIPAVQGTERIARVISVFALHATPAREQRLRFYQEVPVLPSLAH